MIILCGVQDLMFQFLRAARSDLKTALFWRRYLFVMIWAWWKLITSEHQPKFTGSNNKNNCSFAYKVTSQSRQSSRLSEQPTASDRAAHSKYHWSGDEPNPEIRRAPIHAAPYTSLGIDSMLHNAMVSWHVGFLRSRLLSRCCGYPPKLARRASIFPLLRRGFGTHVAWPTCEKE